MTIQQAFHAVRQFLEEHSIFRSKSVVVVTGKSGKICDELPSWCENLGFVRECKPIIDRSGAHGAYEILFFSQR